MIVCHELCLPANSVRIVSSQPGPGELSDPIPPSGDASKESKTLSDYILSLCLDPLLLRTCSHPMSRSVGYSFCAYALGCRRTHWTSFAAC